jgi:hypothetical protein
VIMETKLDAKLVVFMMLATLVLELLVLHRFVVLSAETLLKQDQSNVIMVNKIGCQTGCAPDLGFTCTGAIGAASTCAVTCGDGVKGGSEQCDNGNKIGCQTNGCKFDAGYSCSGAFGQPSVCFQISVEILFLEMANSAIMVIKLVALNVKSFLDIFVQVI